MRLSNHQPNRPLWDCRECARDWPCPTAQQRMLDLYRTDRDALGHRLGGIVMMMIDDDLPLTGSQLFERIFAWTSPKTRRVVDAER